ncbi:agglutinin biogenesis protein MshI [Herbaspirillum sp. HC18]|nr:agglutinin biogenesis protein MshI [Herbaspirillum sp. HC18]
MRFLFGKPRKNAGWMAIAFRGDQVFAVHVVRSPSAMPCVNVAITLPVPKNNIAGILETLAKELHLGKYQCTTLLDTGEYQLLSVDAPNVPPEELKTAIRWRLKDMLDFHIDDATVDVLDVPIDKNAPTRNHSMYAVAARNQFIEQRQTAFIDAKIPLSVIDIPEMAQRNMSALLEPEGRGLALLSFDTDGGLLTVTYAGELYLSRRIDIPLSQLSQADEGQRTACYDRITLELQRSLDHFDRQYHFITLSKLVIAPLEDAAGLQAYLASNLYVPVEALNLESIMDLSKVPELKALDMQRRYFMALGAGLRLEEKAL